MQTDQISLCVDPEIQLHLPQQDTPSPQVSIVIPAMNEKLTIGTFVDWCKAGLAKAGVPGEILIVDSSSDETSVIALEHGARVLKTPKRGLGRAYLDAIPYIRSEYIIMGDADLTYDFREIAPFIERFKEGYQYIMGSRFKGFIEPGAMPVLHRYFGTPGTTFVLNVLYGSHFSDIHCGMRGITKTALIRMNLQSQSWEYASEMVLKSVHLKLKTDEVPIRFNKDHAGRLSHLKRSGWMAPWKAAWINLRAMFVNGVDFFLFKPGIALLVMGLGLILPLMNGPVTVGSITFSVFWMLLGLVLSILGLQFFYMGILAKIMFDYNGSTTRFWGKLFSYNGSVVISVLMFFAGLVPAVELVREWFALQFKFTAGLPSSTYPAILGLLMMTFAFMHFTFTLMIHALMNYKNSSNARL